MKAKDMRLTKTLCDVLERQKPYDGPLEKRQYVAWQNVLQELGEYAIDKATPGERGKNLLNSVDVDRIAARIIMNTMDVALYASRDTRLIVIKTETWSQKATYANMKSIIKTMEQNVCLENAKLKPKKVLSWLYADGEQKTGDIGHKPCYDGHAFTGLEHHNGLVVWNALRSLMGPEKAKELLDHILDGNRSRYSKMNLFGCKPALDAVQKLLQAIPGNVVLCSDHFPTELPKIADTILLQYELTGNFPLAWCIREENTSYGRLSSLRDTAAINRSFSSQTLPYPNMVKGPTSLIVLSDKEIFAKKPNGVLSDDLPTIRKANDAISNVIGDFDSLQGAMKWLDHKRKKGELL